MNVVIKNVEILSLHHSNYVSKHYRKQLLAPVVPSDVQREEIVNKVCDNSHAITIIKEDNVNGLMTNVKQKIATLLPRTLILSLTVTYITVDAFQREMEGVWRD